MKFSSLCVVLLAVAAATAQDRLPDNLLMGFATASYQIEGGWDADGKGENVWDKMTHERPDMIFDWTNGDIADDSYHKYKEDVQILKSLNAQVYRFSLSWSRILPTGFVDVINQAGIDYYKNLISELKANGIQPMVTLFHWDLPQPLQDLGGWANPHLANYFRDYADVAFKNFGNDVKFWITFNEPLETCLRAYGGDNGAPAVNMPGIGDYLCTHTVLLAHANAYHLYDDNYRGQQGGKLGITLNGGHCHPNLEGVADDIEAAETSCQFQVGWFANAIFTPNGDYPAVMRQRVDANSQAEGRPRSRLPVFTPEQVQFIKGSGDFLGVNHYSTYLHWKATSPSGPDPSWERDHGTWSRQDESWPSSASDWLKVVPWGLRAHLNWIKETYNNPLVYVTENGFSDYGDLNDQNRVNYYNGYLHELVTAINVDGCNVQGYTAWSVLDNFEWRRGYSERFGIYKVDYNDPNRPRSEKTSAGFFRNLLATRTLPPLSATPRVIATYDFYSSKGDTRNSPNPSFVKPL